MTSNSMQQHYTTMPGWQKPKLRYLMPCIAQSAAHDVAPTPVHTAENTYSRNCRNALHCARARPHHSAVMPRPPEGAIHCDRAAMTARHQIRQQRHSSHPLLLTRLWQYTHTPPVTITPKNTTTTTTHPHPNQTNTSLTPSTGKPTTRHSPSTTTTHHSSQ